MEISNSLEGGHPRVRQAFVGIAKLNCAYASCSINHFMGSEARSGNFVFSDGPNSRLNTGSKLDQAKRLPFRKFPVHGTASERVATTRNCH